MKIRQLKHRRRTRMWGHRTGTRYSSLYWHLTTWHDLLDQARDAEAEKWILVAEDVGKQLIGTKVVVDPGTRDHPALLKGEIGFIDDSIKFKPSAVWK